MNSYSNIPVLFMILVVLLFGVVVCNNFNFQQNVPNVVQPKAIKNEIEVESVKPVETPIRYVMEQKIFVGQTFNNCGPASLSMTYSLLGLDISQSELADKLRPFNNPQGGLDDKSVFAEEFVKDAESRGFQAVARPNGDISIIEKLVASDIPVVVRTWLNASEDIGHFRVIRGYDKENREFVVDDSYNGSNLRVGYDEFYSLWQPFNYSYIVVFPESKSKIVQNTLGMNFVEKNAWKNALERADEELKNDPQSMYAGFNKATAYSRLGEHEKAVAEFEKVENRLPKRMLWYQLEIIESYLKIKNYERVFSISNSIISNDNVAFSELYIFRGDAFKAQGKIDEANKEYEKAVLYNKNYSNIIFQ